MEVRGGVFAVEAKVDDGALLQDDDPVEEAEGVRRGAVDCGHNCDALAHQVLHNFHDLVCREGVEARSRLCMGGRRHMAEDPASHVGENIPGSGSSTRHPTAASLCWRTGNATLRQVKDIHCLCQECITVLTGPNHGAINAGDHELYLF